MSPAAGGSAPAQSVVAAAVVAPAIAGQDPDRAPARRDPSGQVEGNDPANAAARKTAWAVPEPIPATADAAAANPGGGIIGGDASWPALAESKRGKSASSDSLKSVSDGYGPSAQEDSIAASVPAHPVVEAKPISTGSNPTATLPPNAAAAASSQQNGATTQPNPGRRSGSNGRNNGGSRGNGSSGSGRAANSSGGGGSSGSGGDGNRNGGSLGSGSSCNSSNGDGGSNLNDNVPGSGTSGNGNDSSGNTLGNNNWNVHGGGSRSSNGNAYGNNRNSGGSSSNWNNNSRYSNGTSNGGGGRGGYRGRRYHERGDKFSPRNYPRGSVMPYHQQQQPGVYQPGSFHRPPPPTAHFMVPQHFVPYVPPFAYHGDVQSYPLYLPPVEQFQNMHLVRQPMQPSWVPQDQPNLQEDIRMQIEFYFSTNNLCHDTFLRRHMNDQGWVPIDLILSFNRMRAFTGLVDTNYILDAIRGSESLEVQGNNVRRRNDWADWLLH